MAEEKKRLYLAGPDVFLPNAGAIGEEKRALCDAYGFIGLFPLDNEPPPTRLPPREHAQFIYRGNVAMMRSADAILANVTPFRGPSADVGTAFEMGFFAALNRPIFAYSADPRSFAQRSRSLLGLDDQAERDAAGNHIEAFDLPDNLMLPGAVADAGGDWVIAAAAGADPAAMAAFEQCLIALKSSPSGGGGSAQR